LRWEPSSPASCELSIVIPAFNEERRLPQAIDALTSFMDEHQLDAEVLLVENGSTDSTGQIADAAASRDARFRAIHLAGRGKGLAVRTGMLASRGRLVLFCDADFSMPVEEILLLTGALDRGADVAVGSREVPGARRIGEPSLRHVMGRVFNWLVRVLAVPGIRDTQCGFKGFQRAAARDLFARQQIDGWAFDVEVLVVALQRGYRLREVPITWRYDASSRVHPVRDTMSMIREVIRIRRNVRRGQYV
jgi:dolichyl-phosphate beta-glucosyltransferase